MISFFNNLLFLIDVGLLAFLTGEGADFKTHRVRCGLLCFLYYIGYSYANSRIKDGALWFIPFWFLITFLFIFLYSDDNIPKKILYSVIFIIGMDMAEITCISGWKLITDSIPYLQTGFSGFFLMRSLTTLIKVFVFYHLARFAWPLHPDRINGGFLLSVSLPLFVFLYLRFFMDNLLRSMGGEGDTHLLILNVLLGISTISCLFTSIYYASYLQEKNEVNEIQHLLELQRINYQNKIEQEENLKCLAHDINKQLSCIRNLSENEAISRHVAEIRKRVQLTQLMPPTNNVFVDAVLQEKAQLCREKGITLHVLLDCTLISFVNSVDLCAIFSNAIDNAIEASCQIDDTDKRYIDVKGTELMGYYVIRFVNYYQGTLLYKNHRYQSSKPNTAKHGIGLNSLERSVRKYEGYIRIQTDDQQFQLMVFIPLHEPV